MTPEDFRSTVLCPGLAFMENRLATIAARPSIDLKAQLLMLAIAGQESRWTDRMAANGPVHGFWRLPGGPGRVVFSNVTQPFIRPVCAGLEMPFAMAVINVAMVWNDHLAVTLARLTLWLDTEPLPDIGDESGAWNYYARNWRPERPDRDRWNNIYQRSWDTIAPYIDPVTITVPGIPSPGGIGQPG